MKFLISFFLIFSALSAMAMEASLSITQSDELRALKKRVQQLEENNTLMKGMSISGQLTIIDQSSNYTQHQKSGGTVSSDLVVEKKLNNGLFQMDIQFANGAGVDANQQGGAMVNNDVMEDPERHNQPYLAKIFYHHEGEVSSEYRVNFDIGKFGVNDFFDQGIQVSDQTTQFLNQAVNNNGAFDYVQDLSGHGYTYGIHLNIENDDWGIDGGLFSSDSFLDNIDSKYSAVIGVKWTPEWEKDIKSFYQIYTFTNYGEYGSFDSEGNFQTADVDLINSEGNLDHKNKSGYGLNINHSFYNGIDLFAKYGRQDDNRDVRHYQDMDQTYLLGMSVQGYHWKRELDAIGVAYEIGQLTGNHRKAHEKGYTSFFDRSEGIGIGNYQDERAFEMYYRYALNQVSNLSFDFQNIENFNYNKAAKTAQFFATRFNLIF